MYSKNNQLKPGFHDYKPWLEIKKIRISLRLRVEENGLNLPSKKIVIVFNVSSLTRVRRRRRRRLSRDRVKVLRQRRLDLQFKLLRLFASP